MLGSIVKEVKIMLEPYQKEMVKLEESLAETNVLLADLNKNIKTLIKTLEQK